MPIKVKDIAQAQSDSPNPSLEILGMPPKLDHANKSRYRAV